MKKLIKLLRTSLICLTAPALFASSSAGTLKAEKQNGQVKHGKNGRDGKSGKSWKYGENGQNGEDGKNGGNGGKGGDGGFGWFKGGNGGRGGDGGSVDDSSDDSISEQTDQDNDELDYSTLKEMCRQVVFATVAKFSDSSEDECLLSLKTTISTYLTQVGTSAARMVWQEYESVEWSYPDILSI
jgi:hypothetical protein